MQPLNKRLLSSLVRDQSKAPLKPVECTFGALKDMCIVKIRFGTDFAHVLGALSLRGAADTPLPAAATRLPWGSAPLPAVLPGLPVLPAIPLPPAAEEQRRWPALLRVDRRGRAGDVGLLQDIRPGARRAAGSAGQNDELGAELWQWPVTCKFCNCFYRAAHL